MSDKTETIRITRWSGRIDTYEAEAFTLRNPGLVIDLPNGNTVIEPWRQIIRIEIEPPKPPEEPQGWRGGM